VSIQGRARFMILRWGSDLGAEDEEGGRIGVDERAARLSPEGWWRPAGSAEWSRYRGVDHLLR